MPRLRTDSSPPDVNLSQNPARSTILSSYDSHFAAPVRRDLESCPAAVQQVPCDISASFADAVHMVCKGLETMINAPLTRAFDGVPSSSAINVTSSRRYWLLRINLLVCSIIKRDSLSNAPTRACQIDFQTSQLYRRAFQPLRYLLAVAHNLWRISFHAIQLHQLSANILTRPRQPSICHSGRAVSEDY